MAGVTVQTGVNFAYKFLSLTSEPLLGIVERYRLLIPLAKKIERLNVKIRRTCNADVKMITVDFKNQSNSAVVVPAAVHGKPS